MRFDSVEEFQGLKFTTTVHSESNIAAIIGRNGSGKTRLLRAIAEGKVRAFVNDAVVSQDRIRLLTVNELQPNLVFGFDPLHHREQQRQAVGQYHTHKGKFKIDPQQSVATIGQTGMLGMRVQVNIQQVAHVVSRASRALGKDVNDLADNDIVDFFSDGALMAMGSLNVTATMRAYLDRLEQNEYYEFRNKTYNEQHPHRSHEEFRARFGPPPWEVFNDFLRNILDGRYHIESPTVQNMATYEAKLYRSHDGLAIDPSWLSSGEKVLMWLCLSMYATNTGRLADPPKLLLLDEPDSALHPQMVQKLHMVLKNIVSFFGSGIMFTTHSPTSVALFDAGPVWRVSEHDLVEIAKDAAIGELLVGLDQVSIHYTKCRQVYVESHKDEDIYGELFAYLRRWGKDISGHISLSFIPAAPKLPPQNIRNLLKAHLGNQDAERIEAFIQALNGQGNCVQVVGTVQSLTAEGGAPVYGIIDWDLINKPQPYVHVLGADLFYNIESAVLNPLTLGLYLLHNYSSKLAAIDYGLIDGFDPLTLYTNVTHWQSIADGVMKRVLKIDAVNHDIECPFLTGWNVWFDRRYVHMNGHALEKRLKESDAYPFLNALTKRPTLLMDVVQRGIGACHGRSMPRAFAALFVAIQTAKN
jgi:ABC-type dipeptide/oligopeptide/nickel transport system ATPase component